MKEIIAACLNTMSNTESCGFGIRKTIDEILLQVEKVIWYNCKFSAHVDILIAALFKDFVFVIFVANFWIQMAI